MICSLFFVFLKVKEGLWDHFAACVLSVTSMYSPDMTYEITLLSVYPQHFFPRFYAVRVVSKQSGRSLLPRTSLCYYERIELL
jgi:hypothetical protein